MTAMLELDVEIMFRAKLAVKVYTPELGNGDGVWLSYPQVEIADDDGESLGPASITVAKWLAQKVGIA